MFELTIKPGQLTLNELRQISRRSVKLSLDKKRYPGDPRQYTNRQRCDC